jgi:hypothetical protein
MSVRYGALPPTINTGSDKVGSEVIAPSTNLAFREDDAETNSRRTVDGRSITVAGSRQGWLTLLQAIELHPARVLHPTGFFVAMNSPGRGVRLVGDRPFSPDKRRSGSKENKP